MANHRNEAGSRRRQRADIDAADRSLLELERVAQTDEFGGELADARLMPDQPDAGLAGVFFELREHGLLRAARRQGVDRDDGRRRLERRRDDSAV